MPRLLSGQVAGGQGGLRDRIDMVWVALTPLPAESTSDARPSLGYIGPVVILSHPNSPRARMRFLYPRTITSDCVKIST